MKLPPLVLLEALKELDALLVACRARRLDTYDLNEGLYVQSGFLGVPHGLSYQLRLPYDRLGKMGEGGGRETTDIPGHARHD